MSANPNPAITPCLMVSLLPISLVILLRMLARPRKNLSNTLGVSAPSSRSKMALSHQNLLVGHAEKILLLKTTNKAGGLPFVMLG